MSMGNEFLEACTGEMLVVADGAGIAAEFIHWLKRSLFAHGWLQVLPLPA
jgi:hypothetical protein